MNHGFDQFFGFLGGYVDYYRHREFSDLDVLFEGRRPVKVEGYMTDLITDRAVDFVRRSPNSSPFFLYVAYSVPHFPFQPPDRDRGTMVAKDELTQGTRSDYVLMLEDMDRQIGRILESIQDRELSSNTLIVFASDHGAIRPGSNAPYRGFKSGLFEGGTRTACLMRWPGRLPQGVVTDQPTITMDLTASFLKAGRGVVPEGYQSDGIDIVTHFAEQRPDVDRTLCWRAKRGDTVWRAIRHGKWKHVTLVEVGENHQWLFDLAVDPSEQTDLTTSHPKVQDQLANLLADWESETRAAR